MHKIIFGQKNTKLTKINRTNVMKVHVLDTIYILSTYSYSPSIYYSGINLLLHLKKASLLRSVLFQLTFDILAFKNDISFWKGRDSLVGLSVGAVIWRAFAQVCCAMGIHLNLPKSVQNLPKSVQNLPKSEQNLVQNQYQNLVQNQTKIYQNQCKIHQKQCNSKPSLCCSCT